MLMPISEWFAYTLTHTEALMHSEAFPLYHTSCNTFHRPSLFALSYAFTRSMKATNGLQCLSQAFSFNHTNLNTRWTLIILHLSPISPHLHIVLHLFRVSYKKVSLWGRFSPNHEVKYIYIFSYFRSKPSWKSVYDIFCILDGRLYTSWWRLALIDPNRCRQKVHPQLMLMLSPQCQGHSSLRLSQKCIADLTVRQSAFDS